MFKIIDKEIHLTRGDIASINITANTKQKSEETGEDIKVPYIFQPNDLVRLRVMKKGDVSQIFLKKDVRVEAETEVVNIFLSGDETTIGDLINKPTLYWYEVELNPDTDPQTIIGYDKETGAKIFMLYPEGNEINE